VSGRGAARGDRGGASQRPERVDAVLGRFLEASGVAEQVRRHGAIDGWSTLVGASIAQVTKARSISEGTLFVEVRSSAWLMELELMKGEILRRVNAGLEGTALERIVFVLGQTER
jgi:predicted nucleic acid-binding Zn ribbon protein